MPLSRSHGRRLRGWEEHEDRAVEDIVIVLEELVRGLDVAEDLPELGGPEEDGEKSQIPNGR